MKPVQITWMDQEWTKIEISSPLLRFIGYRSFVLEFVRLRWLRKIWMISSQTIRIPFYFFIFLHFLQIYLKFVCRPRSWIVTKIHEPISHILLISSRPLITYYNFSNWIFYVFLGLFCLKEKLFYFNFKALQSQMITATGLNEVYCMYKGTSQQYIKIIYMIFHKNKTYNIEAWIARKSWKTLILLDLVATILLDTKIP